MKIYFIDPTIFIFSSTMGSIYCPSHKCNIMGYYQSGIIPRMDLLHLPGKFAHLRKCRHIVVVKQKNKWIQFQTLLHEYCHYLVDILLKDRRKFHRLIDRVLK